METQILLGLIISILVSVFINSDTSKRAMSKAWVLLGLLSGLIGLVIYLIARKPITATLDNNQGSLSKSPNNSTDAPVQNLLIPDTCPYCKNPNTKKIRLCEWCGNQII